MCDAILQMMLMVLGGVIVGAMLLLMFVGLATVVRWREES